jgi:hypothetical protein
VTKLRGLGAHRETRCSAAALCPTVVVMRETASQRPDRGSSSSRRPREVRQFCTGEDLAECGVNLVGNRPAVHNVVAVRRELSDERVDLDDALRDGSARPGPHGRRAAMTDGSLDGEGSPLYGAASQPRWPVRLVPCGGAGVTGVGARTPRRERATPWPIFASPVPPRKVQVDGLDGVFGTHSFARSRVGS